MLSLNPFDLRCFSSFHHFTLLPSAFYFPALLALSLLVVVVDSCPWLLPFLTPLLSSDGHFHCAEALGVPLHMAFPQPWTPTEEFPHPMSSLAYSSHDFDEKADAHAADAAPGNAKRDGGKGWSGEAPQRRQGGRGSATQQSYLRRKANFLSYSGVDEITFTGIQQVGLHYS